MKLRLRDYLKVAFNARPIGMFVPPNWIGVAAFGLLGLVNPGFWLLGAGLELGYLYTLLSNQRFRRFVEGQKLSEARLEQMAQQRSQLIQLESGDRERYQALEGRCRRILQQQRLVSPSELQTQAEGLDRLLWIYLRLLLTKQSLQRVLRESYRSDGNGLTLEERASRLEEQLRDESLDAQLRRSLAGQLEILHQRQQKQEEARQKLVFLEAELTRIQEQVELIREQAVVAADAQTVSQRIDQISATLGGTTQWIREQQQILGEVEDLLIEPPSILMPSAVEEAS